MGRWATCSGLDRISVCPSSAALPQTSSVSQASDKGNSDHDLLEDACLPGVEVINTSGGPVQVHELLLPAGCKPEICFGWDAVTGIAANYGRLATQRGYPDSPYSTLFGTADVFGVMDVEIGGNVVKAAFVCDWKTGHPNFLPESDSWQMRALAMMAAKSSGLEYAITRITSVREGYVNHKAQKLWMPEELAETEVLLRKMYDAVNRADRKGVTVSDVTVGGHCTFCPAFSQCPWMQSVLGGGRLGQLDTRDIVQAYNNWQGLKTAEKRLGEAVKYAASERPLEVAPGKLFGKTKTGFRIFPKRSDEEAA